MAKKLLIEGKKYLPTAVLARDFSYTSDYLGKLAREGKVAATRVGRQWFIDQESLQIFVAQTKVEKEIRKQELRSKRKAERMSHEEKDEKNEKIILKVDEIDSPVKFASAIAQTVAVVMVGFFLGTAGYLSVTGGSFYGQSGDSLAFGQDRAVQVEQRAALNLATFWDWLTRKEVGEIYVSDNGYGADKEVEQSASDLVEDFPKESVSDQETSQVVLVMTDGDSKLVVEDIEKRFSDEVDIEFESANSGVIKPVFRKETDESYRFLLIPVEEQVD